MARKFAGVYGGGVITGAAQVDGLKELEAALIEVAKVFGAKGAQKLFRASLMGATKAIRDRARDNAAAIGKSGATAKAMARSITKFPGGRWEVFIGPHYGNRQAIALAREYYGAFRIGEYGAGHKKWVRGIYWPQIIELGAPKFSKKPFMRPAFDATSRQAVDELSGEVRKRIEKLHKKARPNA